jgi:hypothetical protein
MCSVRSLDDREIWTVKSYDEDYVTDFDVVLCLQSLWRECITVRKFSGQIAVQSQHLFCLQGGKKTALRNLQFPQKKGYFLQFQPLSASKVDRLSILSQFLSCIRQMLLRIMAWAPPKVTEIFTVLPSFLRVIGEVVPEMRLVVAASLTNRYTSVLLLSVLCHK